MLEYKLYKKGLPRRLAVFLHGYNDSAANHEDFINFITAKTDDLLVAVPQAPEISEKNPQRRQWFGMLKYDPDEIRIKDGTSAEKIFSLYDKTAADLECCSAEVNAFADGIAAEYGLTSDKIYYAGFSQGAMLAVFAALRRKNPAAAVFSLSGLVAGEKFLAGHIVSRPPVYLFHGEDDKRVMYKTLPLSQKWLASHGVPVKVKTYAGLAHHLCEAEADEISAVIGK